MKVDVKKKTPGYRDRPGIFEVVDIPPLRFLMIDGHGDPNEQLYSDADAAALDSLRLERHAEGRSAQTLHLGPFDDEGAVLDEMHHVYIPVT